MKDHPIGLCWALCYGHGYYFFTSFLLRGDLLSSSGCLLKSKSKSLPEPSPFLFFCVGVEKENRLKKEKNKRLALVGMLSSSHNDFEKKLTRVKLQVQLSQQTPNKIRDSKVGKNGQLQQTPKWARALKTEHYQPRGKRGKMKDKGAG
jgi:hypothetical protein